MFKGFAPTTNNTEINKFVNISLDTDAFTFVA